MQRRNYQLILVDETSWCYVQFVNLSENPAESGGRVRIENLLTRVEIDAFNVVIESIGGNEPRKVIYIQIDPSQCRFKSWDVLDGLNELVSRESSVKLSYEMLRFYRNQS